MSRLPTIKVLGGHRDYKKDTECPGNRLYDRPEYQRNKTGLRKP
jgi:hypothetical protein